MTVLVRNEFLTTEEHDYLLALAGSYKTQGVLEANPSGPRRFRKKVYDTPYCTSEIECLGKRISEEFGFAGAKVDPYLGWIISYIEPGGFIKPHIDRHQRYHETPDQHLRCNVLVQGTGEDCHPIIGDRRYAVEERGLWAFFASNHVHGTAVIQGPKPRIVYQFGFAVPGDYRLP